MDEDRIDPIGMGTLTFQAAPNDIEFNVDNKTLFIIKPDGKIIRGEGFTTTDEMSLEFWRLIEEMRPRDGTR